MKLEAGRHTEVTAIILIYGNDTLNMTEQSIPYSKIQVYFALKGDFDPDTVTQVVNIIPTKVHRKGEQHSQFKIKHPRSKSSWCVYSDVGEDQDLETHVDNVLKKLEGSWQSLVSMSAQHEAWLNCVVHSYGGDNPSIGLDREVLKKLAELNAAFDVDLYFRKLD